ncbi:hypothetical protein [Paraburkholderia sp. DGU8]|uniref:hypothetical protein n=1 Tax=Paraburkholderia sp. DGU8 TaxID=3161997 RepID=UPI0034652D31
MTRVRERNLDDKVAATIVEVLDGWSGRLTWDALVEAVERREGLRYTRQTLHRHERIRLAYTVRKKALSGQEQTRETASPELQVALERIARLEGENRRLEAENNALLEQFARWAYNAQTRNLTKEFLNNPLPAVDRERSKPLQPAKKSSLAGRSRR